MKSTLVLLVFSIMTITLFAQEHPTIAALPNSVYVGADGKFESVPDTAVIQLNISVQDNKSQTAYEHAAKQVEQVRQALRDNNIEPKAATIGFFSVQPVYEWTPKQKVTGYRVTTNVTLKLKDFSKIGPITQQLADANVSETQTLNYTLETIDDAKNKAVEDAYRRARNSADAIARASGRTVGELSYASVDTFENQRILPPRPMAAARASLAPGAPAPTEEFTPQTVTVTAHVSALFNLK